MVFSCFAVYLRIIMHGLYHILLVVYGPQNTAQNMVQPVHDYPRRYTAKQLKTIYYSLNLNKIKGYQARIQDFFQRGARKNAENQGHISIELEMYKEYIAELRAKRA